MDPKSVLIGNDHGGYDLAVQVLEYLEAWLTTPYDGGRHDISLGLIAEAEAILCTPGGWTPSDLMR
jgi:ribose 5-phosphate isomerase RpiB